MWLFIVDGRGEYGEVAFLLQGWRGFVLRACARGEQMSWREGERLFEGGLRIIRWDWWGVGTIRGYYFMVKYGEGRLGCRRKMLFDSPNWYIGQGLGTLWLLWLVCMLLVLYNVF